MSTLSLCGPFIHLLYLGIFLNGNNNKKDFFVCFGSKSLHIFFFISIYFFKIYFFIVILITSVELYWILLYLTVLHCTMLEYKKKTLPFSSVLH